MKKTLIVSAAVVALGSATAANAADVSYPDAGMDWNGFYVGGHVGGAIGKSYFYSEEHDGYGGSALAGLQMGVNFDAGNMVYGIVGDVSIADVNMQEIDQFYSENGNTFTSNILASVRGRLGMKLGDEDSTLVYGTAGVGFISGLHTSSDTEYRTWDGVIAPVVGVGAEHKISKGMTVFAEGLAFLADDWLDASGGDAPTEDEVRVETHGVMRVGINFTF